MSDFSNPTKSQEKQTGQDTPESTASKEHAPAENNTQDEHVLQGAHTDQQPEPLRPAAESSPETDSDQTLASDLDSKKTESSGETATPDDTIASPTEDDEQPSGKNSQAAHEPDLSTDASVQETNDSAQPEDGTPPPHDETNDEIIETITTPKVSGRFSGKRVETIRPETASTGTSSADTQMPPQTEKPSSAKKKKEKKPLPDTVPSNNLLTGLAAVPWLTLLIFVALQGGIALFLRDLWPAQEAQTAAVVKDTLAASNWLTPMLDGKPYSGAMPFYFWFASALARIPSLSLAFAIKLSTVLSSALFITATALLARASGASKKTSLTSGMLILGAFIPAILLQLNGLETLFAALVTFAHTAFIMAWKRKRSFVWMSLGFISTAAATLTGGFPGLFLPLLSLLVLTCWRKRPTRFGEWDVAAGFGIFLVIVFSWFAYVYFAVQPEYLLNLVPNILAAPFTNIPKHLPFWWHMLAVLPFMLLPWIVILIVLPWENILKISFYKNILATRNPENIGGAYLWVSAALTCGLYCLIDVKYSPVWLLVLLPQAAILTAKAMRNFSPLRSVIFFRMLAVLFMAAGLGLIGVVNFTQLIPFPIQGWMYLAAILIASAGILWFKAPWNCRLGTVALALIMTILMQPVLIVSAPTIDAAFSMQELAITMEEYAEKDFTPVVFNADPAPFAYFVRKPVQHVYSLHELGSLIDNTPNVILAISSTDWNNWLTKPSSLHLLKSNTPVLPHLGEGFILAVQEGHSGIYSPDTTMPIPDSAPVDTQDKPAATPEPAEEPQQPVPTQQQDVAPESENAPPATEPKSIDHGSMAAEKLPVTPSLPEATEAEPSPVIEHTDLQSTSEAETEPLQHDAPSIEIESAPEEATTQPASPEATVLAPTALEPTDSEN